MWILDDKYTEIDITVQAKYNNPSLRTQQFLTFENTFD